MGVMNSETTNRLWMHIKAHLGEKANKTDLDLKADKEEDYDALDFVMEMGYANPVMTDSNAIYTNGENKIYIL